MFPLEIDDGTAAPTTWTVGEVAAEVAAAVSGAFNGQIWVEGEITNLNRSPRGHVYFTLVDPDDARGAQLPVTLFDWHKVNVNRQIRRAGGGIRIDNGVKVRVRGSVELYAGRSQVQLRMVAIDPSYTLGTLAAARDALLRALAAEGLLEANRSRPLPILPLRIAVVTSLQSAAHADFLHELRSSAIGFSIWEVDARVQGDDAAATVTAAITAAVGHTELDLICIVRGGGAQTDLSAFNHEDIARSIATCPVPVWVGIGHETDRTVADEVAHRSFKTPTACAAALVDAVRSGISRVEDASRALADAASAQLREAVSTLDRRSAAVALVARTRTERGRSHLDRRTEQLLGAARERPQAAHRRLAAIDTAVRAYDPARVMARGWSMTRTSDGRLIRSVTDVAPGAALLTALADGTVTSTVDSVETTAGERRP